MGEHQKQVTLDDVAQTSGVSAATASRALNGRPGVSTKVRKRVQVVAKSIGYQPNVAARTLAGGRSGIVGLVMPGKLQPANPCGLKMIQGINDGLAGHNLAMMLWIASGDGSNVLDFLSRGQIDGLLVSTPLVTDTWVSDLLAMGQPTVLLDRPLDGSAAHHVRSANKAGASSAVQHLVDGGRRRIAHIAGPTNRKDTQDRSRGYLDTCAAAGQSVDGVVCDSDHTREGGHFSMRQLLPLKPDAVFAANDAMALGAMAAITEAGLSIPNDIAVVGFNDSDAAKFSSPGLSSVRQNITELARTGVEVLERIIADPSTPPTSIEVDCELIVRESSASAS